MKLVTTETIAGYTITETLGVVSGNTVRARNFGRDFFAGLKNLVGGEISEYSDLLTQARDQATQRMVEQAQGLGADAVVNIRFNTSQVAEGAAEVMVFGTAVKLG